MYLKEQRRHKFFEVGVCGFACVLKHRQSSTSEKELTDPITLEKQQQILFFFPPVFILHEK